MAKKSKTTDVNVLATELANGLGRGVKPVIEKVVEGKTEEVKPVAAVKKPVRKPRAAKPKADKPATEKKPRAPRKLKAKKPEAETPPVAEPVKPKVAAPAQAEKPAPAEPPKPAKPAVLSLKERLLAKAKTFDSKALGEKLKDTRDIIGEPATVAYFAELVNMADEVGIQHLAFSQGPIEAQKEWFGLPLKQLAGRINELAGTSDEEAIKTLAERLRDFLESNFVSDPLWRVITDIERPFRAVQNRGQLLQELNRLVGDGLAVKADPDRFVNGAVVVYMGAGTKFVFAPARQRNPRTGQWEEILIVKVGWQFVKKAAERAKEEGNQRYKDLKALEAKATSTAKQALNKEDGTFYIRVGANRGMLLEQSNGKFRITEAIDFRTGRLPTRWLAWDSPEGDWPNQDVWFTFQQWKARASAATKN